jgi:hypothetical protein
MVHHVQKERFCPYSAPSHVLESLSGRRVPMKRSGVWFLVIMVTMSIAAVVAFASNVHLKPPNSEPSFFDSGLTLNAKGNLAGLGNADVLITLIATADPTATCTNPGSGEQRPPGQQPAEVTVTGSQSIPASEIKNGNTSFNVTTDPPVTPVSGAPGCPNPQWREDITDLAFTTAVITVEQPQGTVVLTVSCTFTPATANGTVPGGTVSCTSS